MSYDQGTTEGLFYMRDDTCSARELSVSLSLFSGARDTEVSTGTAETSSGSAALPSVQEKTEAEIAVNKLIDLWMIGAWEVRRALLPEMLKADVS